MNEIETAPSWAAQKEQATMLVKSGFLPASINTPEKAIALILAGRELNVGAMEAMRSINIIQGKPTISPQLMLALANRTGKLKDIKIDSTDERCVVTVTREGRSSHTETFGVKEATNLGLMGKDNYKKQAATMMKWRALAANLRVTFPDVVLGFYTAEEMGAEVKVTEGEEMEIISVPETENYVNTGVRAKPQYWDLKKTDPQAAQEMIGDGNKVQKTDTGWFIFSPESANKAFEASFPVKQEITQGIAVQTPSAMPKTPSGEACISYSEQLEVIRMAKEKGIHHLTMKKMLKDEFGADGSAKILESQYPKVIEAIMKYGNAEIGA